MSQMREAIGELRKRARERTEKGIIRDALRARRFSGSDTLLQGMDLIAFALEAKKAQHEKY